MNEIDEYLAEEKFFKTVVEDGTDIIFIVDYKATIVYHNPSLKKTTGYDSLKGKNFFDYIHPALKKRLRQLFTESTNLPYNSSIEFQFLCSNGEYKFLEFNSINLKHKDNISGLILDCRDISERKKDQEELIKAQKAKELFLANMSHEIRTPVNGISGMVNLLTKTMQSKDQTKYLNAIKHSADNLKIIINDILDFSVIESGNLRLERIGFDIDYQVKAVIASLELPATEKGIKIKYIQPCSDYNILIGDPVRLSQILINLINNAIKFTSNGDITIKLLCTLLANDIVFAKFAITDTGIGIHKNKLNQIFETFKQADESITRKYGGTGLGLAISRQLVELQGGNIKVESEVNMGTTFTFSIPYSLGTKQDLRYQSENKKLNYKQVDEKVFEGMKVLLVEDNDINRLYASTILRNWKCSCDEAENGEIAIELLNKNNYDVILMDVHMPVMGGVEATKLIRKTFSSPKNETPIVAFTANAIKGEQEKYLEIGMSDYISKPFVPSELQAIINQYYIPRAIKLELDNNNRLYDFTYLETISEDNKEFIYEIIVAFTKKTPPLLAEMNEASQTSNWKKIGDLAHKLKPNLTLLGISQVKELVQSIEADGRANKNIETLPNRVKQLISTCNLAILDFSKLHAAAKSC